MTPEQEAYEQSIQRLQAANQKLAEALGSPELAKELNQNIQTDDISELNEEAWRVEALTQGVGRYLEANQEYYEAMGLEFGEAEKQAAILSFPQTPDDLAQTSYNLEHISPEIERYMFAQEMAHFQEGIPFDENAKQAARHALPDTPDGVAFAAWQIEQTIDSTVANRFYEMETANAIAEYKQDYQQTNGISWQESKGNDPTPPQNKSQSHSMTSSSKVSSRSWMIN